MKSYIEIIYIDAQENARKTNLAWIGSSNQRTWEEFNRLKQFGVDFKFSTFLIDYYNRKGNIADTIAIDNNGFKAITGQKPLTNKQYIKIDEEYWEEAINDHTR